jgi:dolichol-phosphate mannosyltransferase
MPAWNEAEGIAEFIIELRNSFIGLDLQFFVVNDCSTDDTIKEIDKLKNLGIPIYLHNNASNSGHGPSTMTALRLGLTSQAKIIIAIDGDGQFTGYDVARIFSEITIGNFDLVEGNRINRSDPFFRRVASSATRQLVAFRTGIRPIDANTPLRAYKSTTLESLLELLPPNTLIPNLLISTASRKKKYSIGAISVNFIPRRGSNQVGSTWGKSKTFLPSKKFIRFCISAVSEWVSFKI